MTFFSVVIPLYNRANRISSTIQSVLDQTFQDFEIVIVDDGSSDNPAPAIAAFNDVRIRLIRQENGGANRARNNGIEMPRESTLRFSTLMTSFSPIILQRQRRPLMVPTTSLSMPR